MIIYYMHVYIYIHICNLLQIHAAGCNAIALRWVKEGGSRLPSRPSPSGTKAARASSEKVGTWACITIGKWLIAHSYVYIYIYINYV